MHRLTIFPYRTKSKYEVDIGFFSRIFFTVLSASSRIVRSLLIVYSQYWQTDVFDVCLSVCWDQTRVAQCSIELHSRVLLNDEHQYDGPQVQRFWPRITENKSLSRVLHRLLIDYLAFLLLKHQQLVHSNRYSSNDRESHNAEKRQNNFKKSRFVFFCFECYFVFHQWTDRFAVGFQSI